MIFLIKNPQGTYRKIEVFSSEKHKISLAKYSMDGLVNHLAQSENDDEYFSIPKIQIRNSLFSHPAATIFPFGYLLQLFGNLSTFLDRNMMVKILDFPTFSLNFQKKTPMHSMNHHFFEKLGGLFFLFVFFFSTHTFEFYIDLTIDGAGRVCW